MTGYAGRRIVGAMETKLAVIVLVLVACREPAPLVEHADVYVPETSAPRIIDETDDTRQALVAALEAQRVARAAIIVSEAAGPLRTTRLWASVEGETRPRATALMADLRHFGRDGRDLAELARQRDWFTRPPPAAELAALVLFGWLPALELDPDHTPVLASRADRLTLSFRARGPESIEVEVVLPLDGPATLTTNDHIDEGGPAELAVLRAAMKSNDGGAILAALQQPLPRTPERDQLLAWLATSPDPALADRAAVILGGGEEAVNAFATVWSRLDRAQRERIRARAEEMHGEGFVTRLP